MKLKTCTKCGRELDEFMFTKDKTTKDGLRSGCKICSREYRIKNRDKILEYDRKYNDLNREKHNEQSKEYYNKNKDVIYMRHKQKTEQDISYKINCNVHKCINHVLTDRYNTTLYFKYLRYNAKQLRQHLESQFTPEMSWDNYGLVWEIDHVIPKNQFQFESYDDLQFKQCWSLSNIRPILKSDNRARPKDGSDIPNEIKQRILKGVCNNYVT